MPRLVLLVSLAAAALVSTGCSSGASHGEDGEGTRAGAGSPQAPGGGAPVSALSLAARSASVSWDATNGKTTLVLQFTARRESGASLRENELSTTLSVDERPLDPESLLQRDSQALAVNVRFCMVLDASYSMLQHSPPAFGPMKAAARDSIQRLDDFWASQGQQGSVSSCFLWFEEMLNWPSGDWRPEDLLALPAPAPGSATRLYSATHAMVARMHQDFLAGSASGERDMHVLVVFSDGADNYSYWDNSAALPETRTVPGTALSYQRVGSGAVELEGLAAAIAGHPRLTVHTIGFGGGVNSGELERIAQAGGGVYVQGSSSEAIGSLFERVLQEATTVQTVGATMPLRPGDYTLTLRVRSGSAEARHTVRFHAGDAQARILD